MVWHGVALSSGFLLLASALKLLVSKSFLKAATKSAERARAAVTKCPSCRLTVVEGMGGHRHRGTTRNVLQLWHSASRCACVCVRLEAAGRGTRPLVCCCFRMTLTLTPAILKLRAWIRGVCPQSSGHLHLESLWSLVYAQAPLQHTVIGGSSRFSSPETEAQSWHDSALELL